ncbi:phosphatase [Thaumasiovibrio sp. DFM-14]|uniref:phosphatase n=1 Tax=Thaumasiovibrio sp. DFM-14 TaxID=3384792 RepID=UPI0039A036DF
MKIRLDTHSHTIASTHAYSTVHDYIAVAKQQQMQLVSITDHTPPMPDAPHWWHFVNMRVIPHVIDNIAILRGAETNINHPSIGLQLNERVKDTLDIIIASFHEPVFPPQDVDGNTAAMVAAIESGECQIIGHPGNPNYPIDQEAVVLAAKQHNVALEINNSSFRGSRQGSRPNCEQLLALCKKHDALISVGSDAHIAFDLGHFDHSVNAILAAGIAPENIVNATPPQLIDFLSSHRRPLSQDLFDWVEQFR